MPRPIPSSLRAERFLVGLCRLGDVATDEGTGMVVATTETSIDNHQSTPSAAAFGRSSTDRTQLL